MRNPPLVGSSVILLLMAICGLSMHAGYESSSEAPCVRWGERRIMVTYIRHDLVNIASDADFAALCWPGDRTKSNPRSGT